MLAQYHAVTAFLRASKASLSAANFETTVSAQFKHLQGVFASGECTIMEATLAMNAISNDSACAFTGEQRNDLANIVASSLTAAAPSVVAAPSTGGQNRAANQNHGHMENYFTSSDWNVLTNNENIMFTRIDIAVRRCFKIGLLFPDEKTSQGIVAIVIAAAAIEMSQAEAFDALQMFKTHLKKMRKTIVCELQKPPIKYPDTSEEFCLAHPGAYKDEEPVAARVSHSIIAEVCVSIPMRKSCNVIATKAKHCLITTQLQPAPAANPLQPMLELMLQRAMQQFMPAGAPDLHIFRGPGRGDSGDSQNSEASSQRSRLLSLGSAESADTRISEYGNGFQTPQKNSSSAPTTSSMPGSNSTAPESTPPSRVSPKGLNAVVSEVQKALEDGKLKRKADREADEQAETDESNKRQSKKPSPQPKRKAIAKSKPKAAAKAKAAPKAIVKGKSSDAKQPAMPELSKQPAVMHRGCKIYTCVSDRKWRVLPKPGVSLYDKAFKWGEDPMRSWRQVLAYCDNPVLPALK